MKRFDLRGKHEEIIRLYKEGWGTKQLGEKYDCDHVTILRILEKHGVPRRPRGAPPGVPHLKRTNRRMDRGQKINVADAKKLREEGWSLKQIGEKYGVSHQAVSVALKKEAGTGRARHSGRPRRLDYDEVVRLYQEGRTAAEVGEILDCCYGAVLRVLRLRGVDIRRSGPRPEKAKRPRPEKRKINLFFAQKLREEGATLQRIAEIFGITRQAVFTILKRYKNAA